MSAKQSPDALVSMYRREVAALATAQWAAARRNIELEVRLQDVDAVNFASIYTAMTSGAPAGAGVPSGAPTLSMTVGAIMPARPRVGAATPPGAPAPSILREITYARGAREGERYVRKEPLTVPWHSPRGSGLAYSVALSAESATERGAAEDERAIIRVKARASFYFELPASEPAGDSPQTLRWRVDLTVVREISGTEVSGLPAIVAQMFRTNPPLTPATMLRSLGIVTAAGDIVGPVAAIYRFEVEAEFVAEGAARDQLRAADIAAVAEFVLGLASPARVQEAALQAVVFRAARFIVRARPGELRAFERQRGLRQLLPQVRALTRADYRELYPLRNYYITDKADGRRALGLARDGRGHIAADELYEYSAPQSATHSATHSNGETVLDGELVTAADGSLTFYAFDVIAVAGADLSMRGFEERILRLAEGVAALVAAGVPAQAKAYTHIVSVAPSDLERAVRSVHDARRPYEIDGLIFVEPGQPYSKTTTYKWKGTAHNTIDFLARRPPAGAMGAPPFVDKPGHELYFLFVGVSAPMYSALGLQRCPGYAELFPSPPAGYFPIQFAPSDAPLAYLYDHPVASKLAGALDGSLDNQIVELRCAGDCEAAGGPARVNWELVRLRTDRRRELAHGAEYFGNDERTAALTWLNYIDPFPLEQLWEGPSADYFQKPRAGVYRAQTAVMNYAKGRLIDGLRQAAWVVDIGAGRGSDLGRYFDAGVGHLAAVDSDRAALAELVRRRYNHVKGRAAQGHGRSAPQGRGTTLHILAADANSPHAELRAQLGAIGLPVDGADALVCNLAVHYFMGSTESMKNFAMLARASVRPGGTLALTILDGALVHEAFRAAAVAAGGTWDRLEPPAAGAPAARKYSLRRDYASDKLEAVGQRIGVLLPFSDGQYYDEYLVNVTALTKVLAARGFGAPTRISVADTIAGFAAQNRPLAAELTAADREWLSLYATLEFRRDK
jgi:SAM-dependent methyltransferase